MSILTRVWCVLVVVGWLAFALAVAKDIAR
jgi:hypothetical protein